MITITFLFGILVISTVAYLLTNVIPPYFEGNKSQKKEAEKKPPRFYIVTTEKDGVEKHYVKAVWEQYNPLREKLVIHERYSGFRLPTEDRSLSYVFCSIVPVFHRPLQECIDEIRNVYIPVFVEGKSVWDVRNNVTKIVEVVTDGVIDDEPLDEETAEELLEFGRLHIKNHKLL